MKANDFIRKIRNLANTGKGVEYTNDMQPRFAFHGLDYSVIVNTLDIEDGKTSLYIRMPWECIGKRIICNLEDAYNITYNIVA